MDYHHVSCWIPTQSGWGKSITKKLFTSWPGLSSDLMQKYLTRNNQPYLATFDNQVKAYYPHRKGTPGRTRSRTRPIYPIHAFRRHQSCLPQDSGCNREKVHEPNRKVPSYIQQGQQLYTGSVPLWLQHHSCITSKTRSGLDLKTSDQKIHS